MGSFDIAFATATLGASASAICTTRDFLGHSPDFQVSPLAYLDFGVFPASLVFGLLMGFLGTAYNRTILVALNLSSRFTAFHGTVGAVVIGAFVGAVGWFMPLLIGSGDALTQSTLDGSFNFAALGYGFLLHFSLSPISYSTRTPGGLFAPMLAVGAQAGALFFAVWAHFIPYLNATPQHFVIIGMAAFFASVVRPSHWNHPGSRTHGHFLSVLAYACCYFRCRHSRIACKVSAHLRVAARGPVTTWLRTRLQSSFMLQVPLVRLGRRDSTKPTRIMDAQSDKPEHRHSPSAGFTLLIQGNSMK